MYLGTIPYEPCVMDHMVLTINNHPLHEFSCTKGYEISGNDHKKTIRIKPEECEAEIHFEDDEVSCEKNII